MFGYSNIGSIENRRTNKKISTAMQCKLSLKYYVETFRKYIFWFYGARSFQKVLNSKFSWYLRWFSTKREKPLEHPFCIYFYTFACSGKIPNKHFSKLYSSHLNSNKRKFRVTFHVKLLKWILLINDFYFVFFSFFLEKLLKWSCYLLVVVLHEISLQSFA